MYSLLASTPTLRMAALHLVRPVARNILRLPCHLRSSRGLVPTLSRSCTALSPHRSVLFPTTATRFLTGATSPPYSAKKETSRVKGLRLHLDVESSALIDTHREALRSVLAALRTIPEACAQDLRLLEAEIRRLGDGFFMLVVAGEYNAGKSSLINALVGRDVLGEGPTPTTSAVTKLKYADEPAAGVEDEDGVVVVGEPVSVLANRLQIVDTPGTNAIDRGHEALTRDFLPLCDIVLFVTSADRPFSESERLFLESIRKWGKKVVMVVNKMDLLDEKGRAEVVDFVSGAAKSLLGSEPKVFALSSKYAKMAKVGVEGNDGMNWEASGFASLEDYINESLDSLERLRLKLRASASVGKTLAEKYILILESNKAVVDADLEAIRNIESHLQRHEETIRKASPGHLARVENVLMEILDRADAFFDSHIRLSNLWNLSNRASVEQIFEDEVVKGTAKAVKRQIQGLGEWLSDASSKNLAETTALFSRRVGERAREISALYRHEGTSAEDCSLSFPGFPSARDIEIPGGCERFVTRLSEVSDDLSTDYISRREGKLFADKIADSVRLSAGLGVGALGSLSVFLVNSSSLAPTIFLGDPTVAVIAGVLGALGLMAVPRRRMALRAELRAKVANTRARLRNELRIRIDEQLNAHVSNIREALRPFADFSETKNQELRERTALVQEALRAVQRLSDRLNAVDSLKRGRGLDEG